MSSKMEHNLFGFKLDVVSLPVALVHSIRILAARSIVSSHPRAHWVSGDRPLRCIRVPLRDAPPTGNPWVCFEGGWTWVGQQTCLFSFAWSAGRTGWRALLRISSFGGGPNYICRLSGADNITYDGWGPATLKNTFKNTLKNTLKNKVAALKK